MKKWFTIYLILNFLASALPGSWVVSAFKLVNLVEHYHHHQHEKHDHNFFGFLTAHYADKHHEEDHDNHENLPFHHHHDQQNLPQQVLFLLPQAHKISVSEKLEVASNPLIFSSQDLHSSLFSGDIWQPPKA